MHCILTSKGSMVEQTFQLRCRGYLKDVVVTSDFRVENERRLEVKGGTGPAEAFKRGASRGG